MIMDFVDLTVDSDEETTFNVPPTIHDEDTFQLAPDINLNNIKTEQGPFRNIFETVTSSAAEPNPTTSELKVSASNNSPTAEQNPSTSNNSSTAEPKPIMFDNASTAEPNPSTPNNSLTAELNPSTCKNSSTAEQNPSTSTNSSISEQKPSTCNNSSTAEQKPSKSNNSSRAEQNQSASHNLLTGEPKLTTSDSSPKAKKKNRKRNRKSKKTDKGNVSSSENYTLDSDSEEDIKSKKSSNTKKKNRKRKSKQTDKSCSEIDSESSENDDSDTGSEASSKSKPKKRKRKPEGGKKSESIKQDKEKQRSFIKEAIQDMKSESIDDGIAEIWAEILKKGLQDKKRELLQQFSYPENCKLLKAPILNYINMIEMKINKTTKEADDVVRRKQDQLGLGIGAIGRVINLLAELTPSEKVKKSIQILTNAGQILADVHYSETEARKRAFFPKENHKIIDQLERDDTLFGNNVYNLGLRPPSSWANLFNHRPNKNN